LATLVAELLAAGDTGTPGMKKTVSTSSRGDAIRNLGAALLAWVIGGA